MNDIRDVWAFNFEEEMALMCSLSSRYSTVCISTEFGGVIARPLGSFRSTLDYHYQTMRANTGLVSPIQIGITLSDAKGLRPEVGFTWQFNLKFNPNEQMHQPDTIEALAKTGVNFMRMVQEGIDLDVFSASLIDSGFILSPNLNTIWISQHSGYDLGIILNLVNGGLPPQQNEFDTLFKKVFTNVYDIKLIVSQLGININSLLLNNNSNTNGQAGSQSQLCYMTLLKLESLNIDLKPFMNLIFGFH